MIPTPSATSVTMKNEKPMQVPIIVPSSDVEGVVEMVALDPGSEKLKGEGWRGGEGEKGECGERKGGEGEEEKRGEGTKKQVNKPTVPIKFLVSKNIQTASILQNTKCKLNRKKK